MFAHGLSYLAIPGPSVMPKRVLRAMHRAAPNIYTGELHDVTYSLIPDLKDVAKTEQNVAIYVGNGHSTWEAALTNVVFEGDTVLVLDTGNFCTGWGDMAASLGAKVETLSFGKSSAVDPAQVEDYLRADKEGRIKAILCVLVDTSTGVRNDIKAIRSVMDAAGHDALLMCDCIASMGCDEFHMDEWGVDVAVAGSQKGLMTPPGIGFVWFNDRADAVRGAMPRVSSYWDWRPRVNPKEYFRFFNGTAPTHHIYGLREALDMIKEEGLEQVWARHEGLAHAIWSACDAWSAEGPFEINVKDPNARSRAVTSLRLGEGQGDALRAWCEQNMGVTLGLGIGRTPASAFFRFGHMGHVSGHMVLGFLGAVDTGLKALEIPHGSGALEAASAVLAQHVRGHICAPEPQASQGDVNGCCG